MFADGSKLKFLEYLVVEDEKLSRLSYRFNYVDEGGNLIFRYDNAPHYPEVRTFLHHKHLGDGRVVETEEPSLPRVLREILQLLGGRRTL